MRYLLVLHLKIDVRVLKFSLIIPIVSLDIRHLCKYLIFLFRQEAFGQRIGALRVTKVGNCPIRADQADLDCQVTSIWISG